jgi:hypothetical protein
MRDTQSEPLRCQCSEQGLHRIADEIWWRTKIRPTCREIEDMILVAMVRQAGEQRNGNA